MIITAFVATWAENIGYYGKIFVDEVTYKSTCKFEIFEEHMYIPAEIVFRAFGADISWDKDRTELKTKLKTRTRFGSSIRAASVVIFS